MPAAICPATICSDSENRSEQTAREKGEFDGRDGSACRVYLCPQDGAGAEGFPENVCMLQRDGGVGAFRIRVYHPQSMTVFTEAFSRGVVTDLRRLPKGSRLLRYLRENRDRRTL